MKQDKKMSSTPLQKNENQTARIKRLNFFEKEFPCVNGGFAPKQKRAKKK